jgi:hypothetical protein
MGGSLPEMEGGWASGRLAFSDVEAYGEIEREPVSVEARLWLLARIR